jgi:hypothetical protein
MREIDLKVGQTVFTVNAKTKSVDEWVCNGFLPQRDEILVHLTRGTKYMFLPLRCVYTSRGKALEVANN